MGPLLKALYAFAGGKDHPEERQYIWRFRAPDLTVDVATDGWTLALCASGPTWRTGGFASQAAVRVDRSGKELEAGDLAPPYKAEFIRSNFTRGDFGPARFGMDPRLLARVAGIEEAAEKAERAAMRPAADEKMPAFYSRRADCRVYVEWIFTGSSELDPLTWFATGPTTGRQWAGIIMPRRL